MCCCYPSKGTSMTDEALRLALEALEFDSFYGTGKQKAITAIKAALLSRSDGEAKDEPEYYGLTKDHLWMSISKEHYDRLKPEFRMACYTTPPPVAEPHKRTWVGLKDEDEIDWEEGGNLRDLIKAIEAKLKEKNT